MEKRKLLHWEGIDKKAKAHFCIEHVGNLIFEVEADLPGSGALQNDEERRALALRHACLLVRSLANELDREAHGETI